TGLGRRPVQIGLADAGGGEGGANDRIEGRFQSRDGFDTIEIMPARRFRHHTSAGRLFSPLSLRERTHFIFSTSTNTTLSCGSQKVRRERISLAGRPDATSANSARLR